MNTIQSIGIAWYEPETFHQVCALMSDKDKLFARYADWHSAAQRQEQALRRQGATVVRVTLDTVQFPAWCAKHRAGLQIDAQARQHYASFIAAQQRGATDSGAHH